MDRPVIYRRALLNGLACAGVFLSLAAGHLGAQADLKERTLFVSVADKMDNPVEGLGIPDFVVREDNAPREILRVSRATEPMDVAVLVDNASSSGELIPRVRAGFKGFISTLTPQNSVAIVALVDRPTILADYTTNAAALQAGVGRLFTVRDGGMTFLDALFEISNGARRREAARIALVPIVTDGIEYTSHYSKDVIEALTRSGASMYPITVGRFDVGPAGEPAYERSVALDSGSQVTGGRRFALLSPLAIEATMGKVARLLTTQYKVVYSRPETLIPPDKVTVSSSRQGLVVHGTPARTSNGVGK